MKGAFVAIVLVLGAAWCSVCLAQTGEEPQPPDEEAAPLPTVTAEIDVNSGWVWRGITLNDGWVVQPWFELGGISIGKVPVTLNIWSNFDHGDFGGALRKDRFSEVDVTLTAELGAGFTAGFTQYIYTSQVVEEGAASPAGTGEVSLSWSGPWKVVTPTLTLSYDVEEVDGAFFLCSLSHAFALSEKVSLELTGEVGAADDAFAEYYGGTKGGLYHYNAFARLTYQSSDRFGLSVSAGYADHFKEAVLSAQPVDFYAGVSLAWTF